MTLNETLSRLKEQGVKITPQRLEILKVLLGEERYYSAEEILKKVQKHYPAVSFDTVYRTLYLFKKIGLVLELNFQGGYRRFEFNHEDKHHHHLVCLKCGKSKKLSFCPTDCLARIKEEHPEFAVTSHSFEIYGYCRGCRES
ncbi:MAG: Fur family transcriptional regulator [Bacillota bacterium]